jgi:type I restriction enzyme, S subunit
MAKIEDAAGRRGLFTDGDWILSENMADGGTIGVIQLKHLGVGDFLDKEFQFITDNSFQELRCTEVLPGDVLISRMADPIGRACIVPRLPFRTVTAVDVSILRVDDSVADRRFIKHLCNSQLVRNRIDRAARGTTRSRITRTELGEIEIPLPPLPLQQRIAERLERADRLRRTRRYALELSDTFLPAAFLELFGDPEKNPRGWPEDELGELCDKVLDCPHATPIYAVAHTPHPCVRSSDIQSGYLDFSETKYVESSEYLKRIARGKPMPGDVIYCREGARFGNAGRVLNDAQLCLGQRMMLFRANQKLATSEFIWAFLSSSATYRQATRALDGSASPHVNVGEIVAFRVPVPPLSLQQKFAAVVGRVERLRLMQRESIRQAEHLFASLLHRAFHGNS